MDGTLGKIFIALGLFHSGIPPSRGISGGHVAFGAFRVCAVRLQRGVALGIMLREPRLFCRREMAATASDPPPKLSNRGPGRLRRARRCRSLAVAQALPLNAKAIS